MTRRRALLASCLARGRRSAHHGGDLLEGQFEHVMEDEGQSLSGSQGIEHDEERQADRVGKERLVLWSKFSRWADDRIGEMHLEGFLSPDISRAEHIEANAGDDRCQPSARILDLVRLGSAHPHPGVLDCIVGLCERAQHPIGDRPQMAPLLLEALRQPVLLVHSTHPR